MATRNQASQGVLAVLFALAFLSGAPGCMTVSDTQNAVRSSNAPKSLSAKKVVLLPVKTQSSLAPDSVMSMRTEVTRKLGQSVRTKLPGAVVIDVSAVADQLNQKGGLPLFEQLVLTHENTGMFDRQKVQALARMLAADYLLVSRLKAEKMDLFISKGTGGSLDLNLINATTGEVEWAGAGEWKRGGVLGFGNASAEEAANGMVDRALASLK